MKITKLKVAIAAAIIIPSGAFAHQASQSTVRQSIEPEPIKVVKQEKKEVKVEEPTKIADDPVIMPTETKQPVPACDPDNFQDVIEAKVALDKKKSEAEAHKQDYIANRPGQLNNEQLDAMIEMKFGVLINSLSEKYETLKSTRC